MNESAEQKNIIDRMATGGLYEPDEQDTAHRKSIEREHCSLRAKLQSKVLQLTSHVSPDLAVILQQLFLTIEADLDRELRDLNASWGMTVYKAQDAGLQEGHAKGFGEGYDAAMASVGATAVN